MFGKKKKPVYAYDPAAEKPVLRVSICTGETAAGFQDLTTGKFHEVMLIRRPEEIDTFKKMYGIEGELEKTY